MELIIGSFFLATFLLVGHLSVLVRNRLWSDSSVRSDR